MSYVSAKEKMFHRWQMLIQERVTHPTMNMCAAAKPFLLSICRTHNSISMSSPPRIFTWGDSYLFIYLSACGRKGWWNSKWSTIYVGIIIWKWYSQATVLLWSRCYWIDGSEVTGSSGNRLSWMICISLQARRVTSRPRPYLRVVSLLYEPLGAHASHKHALTGIGQSK